MGISNISSYNFIIKKIKKEKNHQIKGKEKEVFKMRDYEAEKQGTKRRIVEAFWELYKTTNIDKITVKNIADACGIYRTTFYLHFTDVYAILEKIEKDLLEDLHKYTLDDAQTEEECEAVITEQYASFQGNAEYLYILLDGHRDPEFSQKYKRELIHQMCMIHRVPMDRVDKETGIIIERTLSYLINLFLELAQVEKISYDKLVPLIDGYVKNGVLKTLNAIMERSAQEER